MMTILESIPARRLFLPPLVHLQCSLSENRACLSTRYSDGRSHDAAVDALHEPECDAAVPCLTLSPTSGEALLVGVVGRPLDEARGRGFVLAEEDGPKAGLRRRLGPSELQVVLRWAAIEGFALCEEAWRALEEASGRSWRTLAWDLREEGFGHESEGLWAMRLLCDSQARELRDELRDAIRACDDRAVHLTPQADGSLRRRWDSSDLEMVGWKGQYDGCGALVFRREEDRLRVYLPSQDWVSWGLQRALLDAWAEEMFGERTPWHWG